MLDNPEPNHKPSLRQQYESRWQSSHAQGRGTRRLILRPALLHPLTLGTLDSSFRHQAPLLISEVPDPAFIRAR